MGTPSLWSRSSGRPAVPRRQRQEKRLHRDSLLLEPLEERRLLSAVTLTPTSFADSSDPTSGSLRAAIIQANAVTGKTPVTIQLKAGTYTLSIANDPKVGHETASKTGDLDLTNTSITLTIEGQGTSADTGTIIDQTVADRVFEIVKAGVKVTFEDLVIEGGTALESGGSGSHGGLSDAHGGGILNNGGKVTLNDVVLQNNQALGGVPSSSSGSFKPERGQGGGIYSAGGVLTLVNTTVENNTATGSSGGTSSMADARRVATAAGEGKYTNQGSLTLAAVSRDPAEVSHSAAKYFNGVNGKDGLGGGLYMVGGKLSLSQGTTFSNNSAVGGNGGGPYAVPSSAPSPLNGGNGGNGGNGQGGGMYLSGVSLAVSHVTFANNTVKSGNGATAATAGLPARPHLDAAAMAEPLAMLREGGSTSAEARRPSPRSL